MPDRSSLPAYTPFASRLLDDVMPLLSDTEWRIICVLVRSTFGWEDGQGGRKQADWLTQSQLKARTGRASAAISHAIDGLVQKKLIAVCDEAGALLCTPQERRNCPGRLLFRLVAQDQDARQASGLRDTTLESGSTAHACLESEQTSSLSEQGYSQSEVHKANTTKETKTKRTPDGVAREEDPLVEKPVDNSRGMQEKNTASIPVQKSGSEVQRFLLAYQELFATRSAQGEMPPIAWGRDGKLVKGLLAQYSYERLMELLQAFFRSEDVWVKQRGYALACFPTLLPTLLMGAGRPKAGQENAGRSAHATPLVIHSAASQQWQRADDIAVSDVSLFERLPELGRRVRGQSP